MMELRNARKGWLIGIALLLLAGWVGATVVYQDDFNGSAGVATTTTPEIAPDGFADQSFQTALDGRGHLIAAAVNPTAHYRLSLGATPLTADASITSIKYTAVLRTPVHEWIAIGFAGFDTKSFLDVKADSGPFVLFNKEGAVAISGGVWKGGKDQTVRKVFTAGAVITAELTFHVDTQTADLSVNGSSVIEGFDIGHEFPVGEPSVPVLSHALIQMRNQAVEGAYVDRFQVEILRKGEIPVPLKPVLAVESAAGTLVPKKVSVSASSELPYEPAFLAVDGDEATGWVPSSAGPNWLQLEFDEPLLIQSVGLCWYPAMNTRYTLEASMDGTVWKTISSGRSLGRRPSLKTAGVQIEGAASAARYVRLQLKGGKQGLAEMEINGQSLSGAVAAVPPLISEDAPYRDRTLPAEQRAANVVSLMTDSEKHLFVTGYGMFYIRPLTRFGLREIYLMDATAGVHLRKHIEPSDIESISYPCAVALAATWNSDLAREYGRSVARECRQLGADILLGPGFNLYRSSTCGRNFEYMGEDPVLVAGLVAPYILGMQSEKVMATAKHFICNNHEWLRLTADSIVDDRALHEMYMYPWYYAVHRGKVSSVMTSYNWLNGEKVSQSTTAIHGLLRGDIGFDGLVMSDWVAVTDPAAALVSGQDLIMPGIFNPATLHGETESETMQHLDRMVQSILTPLFEFGIYERERKDPGYLTDSGRQECEAVALQTAREAITLLKNDGILPLDPAGAVLVLGPGVEQTRYAGGGSGGVEGYGHTHIGSELSRLIGGDRVVFKEWKTIQDDTLRNAATIILCVDQEQRENMDQPPHLQDDQEQLVNRCLRLNPRTVVVVNSGSGIMMDWTDVSAAVVWAYYPGQYGAIAIAEVLTGAVNPSGKLPYTIERKFADSPAVNYKPEGAGWRDRIDPKNKTQFERTLPEHPEIVYQEGIFLGYRWYDNQKLAVRFPFGHGLSYTTFVYSDLQVKTGRKGIVVRATITNTGTRSGSETVQLYVRDSEASVPRPVRELKGYAKIQLAPGESKAVEFTLSPVDLAFYDVVQKNWKVEPGEFILDLAASSRDIRLSKQIEWEKELRYQRPTDIQPLPVRFIDKLKNKMGL